MRLRRSVVPILLSVSVLFAGAACTDAPPDTPTASDELEPGATVKPTPAVGGERTRMRALTRPCVTGAVN